MLKKVFVGLTIGSKFDLAYSRRICLRTIKRLVWSNISLFIFMSISRCAKLKVEFGVNVLFFKWTTPVFSFLCRIRARILIVVELHKYEVLD